MERRQDKYPIVAAFDGDFIPFYVCHNKKGEPEKTLEDCINHCDELISNINFAIKSEFYVGFLTVGKCFRYSVSDTYKANRKYDNLPKYINEVKDHLKTAHNFTNIENYEADDLLVSFRAQNKQFETILVSPDKDILNLEGMCYNPRLNTFKYTSKQGEDLFFFTSLIVGDVADGVKGIRGVGEKGAQKILGASNAINYRGLVLDKYCEVYGEYEGIKNFYINYYLLKLIDTVKLDNLILNKIEPIMCGDKE